MFDINKTNYYIPRLIYPDNTNKAQFWTPNNTELGQILQKVFVTNAQDIFGNLQGVDSIGRIIFNATPNKALISLKAYPINFGRIVNAVGTKSFTIMSYDTGILTGYLKSNYIGRLIDFGYIDVPYVDNEDSFLSYDPYSKLYLYLPFASLVDLDTRRYVGKRIQVYGVLDLYKGEITYLICTKDGQGNETYIEQTSAQIAVDLPVYENNQAEVIQSLAKSLIATIPQAVSGKAPTTLLNTMLNTQFEHNQLLNGNLSAVGNFFSPLKVNLLRYTPRLKYTLDDTKYNHIYGVPTKKIGKIKDFGGFTKVGAIHSYSLSGITQKEIDEIENLLKQGVRAGLSQATLSISYNASHITWASSQSSIKYGLYYSNSFTIDAGYQVDNVQVLMGGADITSTAVSGNQIVIPVVTGNIVINIVTSKIPVYYTITYTNLTGATLSNTATQIEEGSDYSTYLNALYNLGYYLGNYSPTITMGGVVVAGAYNNGMISISNVQGNIVISGTLPQSSKLNSDTWTPKSTEISLFDGEEPITNLTGEIYVGTTECAFTDLTIDTGEDITLNNSFLYGTANISGVGSNLYTGVNAIREVSYETGQTYTALGYMTRLHLSNNVDWTNYGDLLAWLDLNFNKVV